MHYNLTADDYDVEIGELIDQYKPQSGSRHFGLLAIYRSSYNRINGRWEASIHVDERFTGNQVSSYVDSDDETNHVIRVDGYDLCEVLRNVRNAFVASTPVAVAIAKGA